MGYGYAETFLIIFMTHPGVFIPPVGSILQKAMAFLPPQAAELLPSGGFTPFYSGLWQVLWVWILSLPGKRGPAVGWAMYSLYLLFLVGYMYFFASARFIAGI